ncbi:MAG: hypothetical protein V7750_14195 [Sneathiella sp.]
MSEEATNNIVAKELSDAMAKCKQKGVDEQSLRTGLLTITIANFVHRLGMANTVALFEALPAQVTSGIFDQYIDPNTNTLPMGSRPGLSQPPPYPAGPGYTNQTQQPAAVSYQNPSLPQNYIPPYHGQASHPQQPMAHPLAIHPISHAQSRRRLPD